MEMDGHQNDIDLDYIQQHTDSKNYKIPSFYDTKSWKVGETYSMHVSNIYDPSKFWIVLYEKELNIFHEYLYSFYKKNGELYKMPKESVKRFHYCVAFTDGDYYRGLIVDIPFFASLNSKVSVFLFDFGYPAVVQTNDLYYLSKNLFKVPQFSVRSCLYGMEPYSTDIWTQKEVKRFTELTQEKTLLCVLEQTDPSRKLVYITIDDLSEASSDKTIRDVLIGEKLAKMSCPDNKNNKKAPKVNSELESKHKYPYLFPSFEAIEGAVIPPTVHTSEMLKSCIATGVILFKSYFSFNGIDVQ